MQPGCAGVAVVVVTPVWKQVTTPVSGFWMQLIPVCAWAAGLRNAPATNMTATSAKTDSPMVKKRGFMTLIRNKYNVSTVRDRGHGRSRHKNARSAANG